MTATSLKPEEYFIEQEPYYELLANEIEIFEAAYHNQLPILLKGPTGCGKTRFMEHMEWRLKRPLITDSCHDDLTASDLVGRYLVKGGETPGSCCSPRRWKRSATATPSTASPA
jgi:nitric oxide reductase NorQ protein